MPVPGGTQASCSALCCGVADRVKQDVGGRDGFAFVVDAERAHCYDVAVGSGAFMNERHTDSFAGEPAHPKR